MSTRFTLRPYQREAIGAVLRARRAGTRRMVVCLPTGAGKTVIFSELARLARRPVLVLAHRAELVQQARAKIARALQDDAAVAIEQADQVAPASARVVVASIRSLRPDRLERLRATHDFGLVVYDECHHAPAEDNQRVLRALGAFEPGWSGTLLGFTATTSRGDGQGLDAVFQEVVYSRSLPEMIADGYLSKLRGLRIATAADLRGVTAGSGDFDVEELAEAVDIEDRNALVARSIQELARDRRTVVFCVTVRHAIHLARSLNALGIRAGVVHGKLEKEARARVLADLAEGRIDAVTNVGVLTEGFDEPSISCVAMARPTRSEGLYAQCVGRGTRLAPGKTDCLVLDFVDASDLDLVSLPSLAGLPRDLDLRGEELSEAREALQQIWFDHPGFELEAGTITLDEIRRRAEGFDPLKLQVDTEVQAISGFGWQSLGSAGLALVYAKNAGHERRGRRTTALVLKRAGRRGGKNWVVRLDGKEVARFSSAEQAVEAVDYEVQRLGKVATRTARTGGTADERARLFAEHGPRR